MPSLKSKVLHSAKWSALAELAGRLISPIIFLVLARLLTPADYGVAAAAMIVLSFAQTFWDAGMARALVQRQTDIDEASNVVFWTNLGMAVVVYVVLFFCADFLAVVLFKDPRVANVIRVQAIGFFPAATASVHTALCQKQFHFKKLFWVRLFTTGAPGLASIPLALLGWGYWALVAGALVGSVASALTLWVMSPWKPKCNYSTGIAKQMVRFGLWVSGSSLLAWCYLWLDSLLVGLYLDSTSLGLYRTGSTFVTTIFGLVLSPLLPVTYSLFSHIQSDAKVLRDTLLKTTKIVFLISAPLAAGLFATRVPLAEVVFGLKWSGIAPVIGWYALMSGSAWLVGTNSEAYRASGRPHVEATIMSLNLFIYIPAYIIALRYDLNTFVKVRFGVCIAAMVIHFVYSKRLFDLGPVLILKEVFWTLIGGILIALTPYFAPRIETNVYAQLITLAGIGGVIFVFVSILPQLNWIVCEVKRLHRKS